MKNGHRRMHAYGELSDPRRKYTLEDYDWSRNHNPAERIRRWKRELKKKERVVTKRHLSKILRGLVEE